MKHPEFRGRPTEGTNAEVFNADYTTRKGADALAGKIRQAWLKVGHPVHVWVEQSTSGIWAVRSELVDGLPARAKVLADFQKDQLHLNWG